MPDQTRVLKGLEREDLFTVVFDQVFTDTALYADVVLPATTFLEHYDFVKSYGPITLQLARPVIEQVGESRSNAEVFAELIRRVGLARDGDPAGELEAMLQMLDGLPDAARRRVARRCEGDGALRRPAGAVRRRAAADAGSEGPPVSGGARSRGAAGTVWIPAGPGDRAVPAGADFAGQRAHGQLDARRAAAARRPARHAPDDAAERDIEDGEVVRMFNDLGEVRIAARVDAAGAARHGRDAERRVAAQHGQRIHVECARAGFADGPGRRRVLQRRTRAGRENGDVRATW